MSAKSKNSDRPREIRNAKASRDYVIDERYEAGIVLSGTEVKSIRSGHAQISDSFCRIERGEIYAYNIHIDEYRFGNINNHQPKRPRKLLLQKREIRKIARDIEAGGKAVIPLRLYFKIGLVKIEIATCTGKKLFDKREDLKRKVELREVERALKYRR